MTIVIVHGCGNALLHARPTSRGNEDCWGEGKTWIGFRFILEEIFEGLQWLCNNFVCVPIGHLNMRWIYMAELVGFYSKLLCSNIVPSLFRNNVESCLVLCCSPQWWTDVGDTSKSHGDACTHMHVFALCIHLSPQYLSAGI